MSLEVPVPGIIEVNEREVRLFQRSNFFDSLGHSLILGETRNLPAVSLKDALDGIELRVLGLVGYLPLTEKITLNIRPKFPIENLWKMVDVADDNYKYILSVVRGYEKSLSVPPHHLLLKAFCHYLKDILKAGVAKGYYGHEHFGHYQPKINFQGTLTRALSRGDQINVASNIVRFSADLLPNRLLKSACVAFLNIVPRDKGWAIEKEIIKEACAVLDLVPKRHFLPGEQVAALSLPKWQQNNYLGALNIYSVLLGYTGIGFQFHPSGLSMPSFLLSMDDIFEKYIRNTIRLKLKGHGIRTLDGNVAKNQRPLFVDNQRFPTKPDLIFQLGKKVIGIGEVKYKPRIDESDRYQIISHSIALNAPINILISPAVNNQKGMEYIGKINSGTKFYHYRFDLYQNLALSEEDLFNKLIELIQQ